MALPFVHYHIECCEADSSPGQEVSARILGRIWELSDIAGARHRFRHHSRRHVRRPGIFERGRIDAANLQEIDRRRPIYDMPA
jgi:hypothetical protein